MPKIIYLSLMMILMVDISMGKGRGQTATPTPNCCQTIWSVPPGSTTYNPDTYGIAFDPSGPGTLFLGVGTSIVGVNPINGDSYGSMPVSGITFSDINGALAMGVSRSQYLYVADNNNLDKIQVSNWDAVTTYGIGENMAAIAVDGASSDDLYVGGISGVVYKVTQGNGAITPLTLNLGTQTAGQNLGGVAVEDPGAGGSVTLYVSYSASNSVYQFVQSSPGSTAFSFAATEAVGGVLYAHQMTEDSSGNIYLVGGNFERFDKNFNLISQSCGSLATPDAQGIAVDPQGDVYLGSQLDNGALAKMGCPSSAPITYPGNNPPDSGQYFIYPSPAKGSQATVSYNMVSSGSIELKIWNEKAELVDEVTDQKTTTGVQITPFNIVGFASGVYFYTLTIHYTSGQTQTLSPQKFVILH